MCTVTSEQEEIEYVVKMDDKYRNHHHHHSQMYLVQKLKWSSEVQIVGDRCMHRFTQGVILSWRQATHTVTSERTKEKWRPRKRDDSHYHRQITVQKLKKSAAKTITGCDVRIAVQKVQNLWCTEEPMNSLCTGIYLCPRKYKSYCIYVARALL